MSEKPDASARESDRVITPGGPRPRDQVHGVRAHEAVRQDEEGRVAVIRQRDTANFVLTPGGFRHRALVHPIEPGHVLESVEGRMRTVDPRTRAVVAAHDEELAVAAEEVPALGSGWITYAYWNNGTGQSITSFRTTWTVPPAPSTNSGQTIFLFNGIQNYGANFGILQPVLQYGPSAAGGGAFWSVASWYVTSGGQAFHTPLVQVNAGDVLVGIMRLTGQSGGMFNYTSEFQGIANTNLPVQNIAELLWCNETLEAYNVQNCSDYPNTPDTAMRAILIQTGLLTPMVTWTPVNQVTDCGQHTIVVTNNGTNGEVDLYYRQRKSRFAGDRFLETVMNPILLWLYRHGWEDPDWGRRDAAQIAIATAIDGLAEQVTDREARVQLKKAAARVLAVAAKNIAADAEQDQS